MENYEHISFGFQWNPEMTFEEFVKLNNIQEESAWDIYCKIERKYMIEKYENEDK
jgi:hypothetical protein